MKKRTGNEWANGVDKQGEQLEQQRNGNRGNKQNPKNTKIAIFRTIERESRISLCECCNRAADLPIERAELETRRIYSINMNVPRNAANQVPLFASIADTSAVNGKTMSNIQNVSIE